jgi:hypothetical protein
MSDLGVEVRSWLRAGHRDGSRSVRRSPGRRHRRVRRQPERMSPAPRAPEPQVIGAPPAHFIEQPAIDPCPDHRRRPQRILGVVVLGLRVGPAFGKVTYGMPSNSSGRSRVAPASSMASAASSSRTSPGKVLFFGCSGASRAVSSPSSRSSAIPDNAARIALARSCVAGLFCFAFEGSDELGGPRPVGARRRRVRRPVWAIQPARVEWAAARQHVDVWLGTVTVTDGSRR